MHEVEVKARVRNVDELLSALATRGVRLSDPSLQHDTIYIQGEWESVQHDPKRVVMRVREQTGRAVLTLKQNGSNELHSIEHETAIASPKEVHRMLAVLGFQPFLEVRKYRRKATFEGVEICLDRVEGLGDYVEVEALLDEGDQAEIAQEQLFSLLDSLGVSRDYRETRGYDTLVRLQKEQA